MLLRNTALYSMWLFCSTVSLAYGCHTDAVLREASGLVRTREGLAFVGDEDAGQVFHVNLNPTEVLLMTSGQSLPVDTVRAEQFGGPLALDLESIDVLPDLRMVVLSERLRVLLTQTGVIAEYPDVMSDIGGRGLEGLAIRQDGRIAALWEGGHFDPAKLPSQVAGSNVRVSGPAKPLLCVHALVRDRITACPNGDSVVVLDVPAAPVESQAFRAPDLVWNKSGDGFIVLLTSSNADDSVFMFKWLQRFTDLGLAVGEPLNLCDRGYLPRELRSGTRSNFEGLAWFDAERLALVNDHSGSANVYTVDISPWPATGQAIACDGPS